MDLYGGFLWVFFLADGVFFFFFIVILFYSILPFFLVGLVT